MVLEPCKTGSEIGSVSQESDQRSSGRQMWTITVEKIKEQSMPLSQGLTGLPEDSMGQTAVVQVTAQCLGMGMEMPFKMNKLWENNLVLLICIKQWL